MSSPYVNAYRTARAKNSTPVMKALTLAGWGVFLLATIFFFILLSNKRSAEAAQTVRLSKQKAATQAEQASENQAQADKQTAATAELARLEEMVKPLEDEGKSASEENDKREQKVDELDAAIAAAAAPPETATPDASASATAGAAEPTLPVLAQQVEALAKEKKALAASYAATYRGLEATVTDLTKKMDPVALQKFYLQYIRTPFAPAALFAAAEAWYMQGDLVRAQTNYEVLMASFADSDYCRECGERVNQITKKKPYTPPLRTGIIPYRLSPVSN